MTGLPVRRKPEKARMPLMEPTVRKGPEKARMPSLRNRMRKKKERSKIQAAKVFCQVLL